MNNFEIMLLPEWHSKYKRQYEKSKKFVAVRMFGSFLDEKSLLTAWKLSTQENIDKINNLIFSKLFQISENFIPLQIILFPISRIYQINKRLVNEFRDILNNKLFYQNKRQIIDKFIHKVDHEIDFFKNSDKYSYYFNDIYKTKSKNIEYLLNKFQYGPLTAKYLSFIKILPYFQIANYEYSGIPLNLSINTFIEKIILPEV